MNSYSVMLEKSSMENYFGSKINFAWQPKTVKATEKGVIVRHSPQDSLFGGTHQLEERRFGLVPPGFSSPEEADRYKKWVVRGERLFYERNQSELATQRCLVPFSYEGRIRTAAGIYARWANPGGFVLSFAILTLPSDYEHLKIREVFLLEESQWELWLNPKSKVKELKKLIGDEYLLRMEKYNAKKSA
jgi:putative SOS response-associated peptidase YedK